MLDYITGRIIAKNPNQVIIDLGGVGLVVKIPLLTYEKMPQSGEIKLFTYLQFHDEEFKLYGFLTVEERELFLGLQSVRGIGPSIALTILSNTTPDSFRKAVLEEDIRFLKRIKGIGEKTAKRIILELKGSLEKITASPHILPGPMTDGLNALVTLGYSRETAEAAVARAWKEFEETPSSEELIKRSLMYASSTAPGNIN